MELIIPSTIQLTFGAIIIILGSIFGAMRAYVKLSNAISNRFEHLEKKIDNMTSRNERADVETEKVKHEQSKQETTIAVMVAQMNYFGETLMRIDGNVNDLVKREMGNGRSKL